MKGLLAAALLCATGCSIDRDGVVHHVILGFGVVSVPKTNTVASVSKVSALGLYCGPGKFVAGFARSTVVEASPSATNIIIEVK